MDHTRLEAWVADEGANIRGRTPLRRAILRPLDWNSLDQPLDGSSTDVVTQEGWIYDLRIHDTVLENWRYQQEKFKHFAKEAESTGRTHGYFRIDAHWNEQKQRHYRLLAEDPVYKQAWQEFQAMRSLLGEDPHWP